MKRSELIRRLMEMSPDGVDPDVSLYVDGVSWDLNGVSRIDGDGEQIVLYD